MSSDLVATWEVALSDGVHLIEFEHGTTTGKRVIRVDGKVMRFPCFINSSSILLILYKLLRIQTRLVFWTEHVT